MHKAKKHIAAFLLALFSLALIPGPVLHSIFADHHDASANHCKFYHKELGRHIEEQDVHCDIFKFNTPLYDAISISCHFHLYEKTVFAHTAFEVSTRSLASLPALPLRAPPIA